MKKFLIFITTVVLLFSSSCTNNNLEKQNSYNPIEIAIDENQELTALSNLIEKVEFIPLQSGTESYFDAIYGVKYIKGHYYLHDHKERILVFDGNGDFETKVDYHGHGPGEYNWIGAFSVDSDQQIHVFDNQTRLVHIYDRDGGFIKSSKISTFSGIQFGVINSEVPNYIFTTNYNAGYDQVLGDFNAFTICDEEIVNRFLPITLPIPTKTQNNRQWLNLMDPVGVFEFNNTINIHLPYSDTIYAYVEDSLIPRYVVNLGDNALPYMKLLSSDKNTRSDFQEAAKQFNRGPYSFLESESFVFFKFHLKQKFLCCLYSKVNQEIHHFSVQPDYIDVPFFRNPAYLAEDCIFFHVEPISILQYIDKRKAKDKTIVQKIDQEYPGFRIMFESLNENDNTIIIKAFLSKGILVDP